MLRLPPFKYRRAASAREAAEIVAGEAPGSVRFVAGGTDLWPNMKRRHQQAETVVSLMGVPDLSQISANGELSIGATAILDDVAQNRHVRELYPALSTAVTSISSPPLRQMGTIGGNVCVDTRCTYYNQSEEWRRSIDYCMKEAGTICWVAPSSKKCLAHSASDSAPILAALGARARLVSAEGERELPVADLFIDDGIDYLGKRADEVLTHLLLPDTSDAESCRSAFWKLRRRGSIDFAVVSAAAALWTASDGTVERANIVLGAVASCPSPAREAADFLVGKKLEPETLAEAARLAKRAATPMDNTDFHAQWRGAMVVRYVEAALRECAGLPVERIAPKQQMI